MNTFLENWLKELHNKWLRGDYLSADDRHRLEVLRYDKWRETKINEANKELPWGGAWWKAINKLRGDDYDDGSHGNTSI